MQLMAVDPGKHACGWALFDADKLVDCGLDDLAAMAKRWSELDLDPYGEGVIERPQVYNQRYHRGDPNDLIDVAISAGAAAQMLLAQGWVVQFVVPHDWKGNRPKDVDNAVTRGAMLPHEQVLLARSTATKHKRHNVVDAIGIGLWKMGRRP